MINNALFPFLVVITLVIFTTSSLAESTSKPNNLVTIYGSEKNNTSNEILPEVKSVNEARINTPARELAFESKVINPNDIFSNSFFIELGFEKFQLSGTGFNANLDYSKNLGVFDKLVLKPSGKNWNIWFSIGIRNTFLNDLNGLTPRNANLSNIEITLGNDFHFKNFSLGPVLQFDKTFSTLTAPDAIEVRKKSFLTGFDFHFANVINPFLGFDFFLQLLVQVTGNLDSYSNGIISDRYKLATGILFDFESENHKKYFTGIILKNESTEFLNGTRNPSSAKEAKTSIAFPFGIKGDFL